MLITSDHIPNHEYVIGEFIVVVSVCAVNVVKDTIENVRNLIGGTMVHYERLIDTTIQGAIKKLEQNAKEKGYDGVLSVKISHPYVVDGGVEIIIYGNGFNFICPQSSPVGQNKSIWT